MEEQDPLAHFFIARLKFTSLRAALAGFVLGLIFVFLPVTFEFLWTTAPGRLGSLDDWHTQVLVLAVAPSIWFFYLWQPRALSKYGGQYPPASWRLSALIAIGAVIYDLPEMITAYGQWWATDNPVIIALRETLLLLSVYMLATVAQRHLYPSRPHRGPMTAAKSQQALAIGRYYFGGSVLWGILGSRLSIEVVELPARAGSITPDFYLKTLIYLILAWALFITPLPRPLAGVLARLLAIVIIPAAFLLLFLALGLGPQFAF